MIIIAKHKNKNDIFNIIDYCADLGSWFTIGWAFLTSDNIHRSSPSRHETLNQCWLNVGPVWGWWDEWDETVLQTQDSKLEPWRSEVEHATSRSRRLPTILSFTRGWEINIFVSFKPPRPGTEPRTLAWKAAVLTTTLGPPPNQSKGLEEKSSLSIPHKINSLNFDMISHTKWHKNNTW